MSSLHGGYKHAVGSFCIDPPPTPPQEKKEKKEKEERKTNSFKMTSFESHSARLFAASFSYLFHSVFFLLNCILGREKAGCAGE